jgi:single-stranded-DNA-specific exonuclease
VEKTGRPALVVATEGDEAHGSGRSISALHLLDALESCHDLFTRFGGHAHAVGFALPAAQLPELKLRLNKFAQEHLTAEDLVPSVAIDAELPLASVTPQLLKSLEQLEPFGQGNPQPVFSSQGARLTVPPRIIKDKHIKLRVKQADPRGGTGFSYEAMGWRMAERLQTASYQPGDEIDIAFTVGMNLHPDFGGLELVLEDFRKAIPAATTVCSSQGSEL